MPPLDSKISQNRGLKLLIGVTSADQILEFNLICQVEGFPVEPYNRSCGFYLIKKMIE